MSESDLEAQENGLLVPNTTKRIEKLSATLPPKSDKMQVGHDRSVISNYRLVEPKKLISKLSPRTAMTPAYMADTASSLSLKLLYKCCRLKLTFSRCAWLLPCPSRAPAVRLVL